MANKAVFGIAKSEAQAITIADNLKAAGFTKNDVSVLFPDKKGTKDFAHEQHTKAPEGAATGAGTGAILGGALGWMVGIGALAIPGLSVFIAAGPIMAALAGAAGGAAAGGLTGALSAWVFRGMRQNATKGKSRTETSCCPFTLRTALSAIALRKFSRAVARKRFRTLARPPFPRTRKQRTSARYNYGKWGGRPHLHFP